MGRVAGKVALITGVARGQGRSHAIRLAQEGADIIGFDMCEDVCTARYAMATRDDLAETSKIVEQLGRRILTRVVDVRELEDLEAAVAEGVNSFGRLDVVVAHAGIATFGLTWELPEEVWQEMIDINLTGAWKTCRATIPQMLAQGTGGSIVLTSSVAGLAGLGNSSHYAAAKHGVVGLMRTLAVELAQHRIRVNTVHPTTVMTPMADNQAVYDLFLGRPGASREEALAAYKNLNAIPISWIEPEDVSNAVLWLASDESRYVTGTTQVIDAGGMQPYRWPNV